MSYCEISRDHPVHGPHHDTEYGRPVTDDAVLLERIAMEINQAGLSWELILKKRPALNAAFEGFEPARVAAYGEKEVERLLQDAGIIRNRRKIEATVSNAQTLLALEREFGGFGKYLKSNGGDFDALVRDMRKRFKFVGTFGAYFFLYVVGEPVPSHEEFRARMAKI